VRPEAPGTGPPKKGGFAQHGSAEAFDEHESLDHPEQLRLFGSATIKKCGMVFGEGLLAWVRELPVHEAAR
jgi:hypothetical protein